MTPERINRKDDESLYQPRIHSRWIRRLHGISAETGEPLTVLVDRALREFVARYQAESERGLDNRFPLSGDPSDLNCAGPPGE